MVGTNFGVSPVTDAVQDRVAHSGKCRSEGFTLALQYYMALAPCRIPDIRHLVVSFCTHRVAKTGQIVDYPDI